MRSTISVYDTNSGAGQSSSTLATTAGITADLAAHTITGDADGSVGTDTVTNIERVVGTNFADTLKGGGGSRFESFQGRGGNDTITGDGIHQTRAEYNDANGDSGGVTITLSNAADGAGTVVGGASIGTDTVKYVNQFYGSQYNDVYNASQFTMRLADRAGDDTVQRLPRHWRHRHHPGQRLHQDRIRRQLDGHHGRPHGGDGHPRCVDQHTGELVGGAGRGGNGYGFGRARGRRQRLRRRHAGGNTSTLNMEYEGFRGGSGNDTIIGGAGFDEARYDDTNTGLTSGVNIVMAAGSDAGGACSQVSGDPLFGVDKLYGVEAVRGSLFNDTYNATGFNRRQCAGHLSSRPLPVERIQPVRGRCRATTRSIGNGRTQIDYRMADAGVTVTFTGHGSWHGDGRYLDGYAIPSRAFTAYASPSMAM